MPDKAPPVPPTGAETPKADEADRDQGKAPAGTHLTRRQSRNSDLTELAQGNPTGGAHSGTPDATNP